jgi:ubiquinone/menaquinone biosynthesis C-methylase UbiE
MEDNKSIKTFEHGSPEAWDRVFEKLDLSYSEDSRTQAQLFEIVKIRFLKRIFPQPPKKMLEVGCGTAFVSLFFAKRGYQVSCLDINKKILEVARKNFRKERAKGNFITGNAERLSFKDNSFDIVTSFGLLEHFQNPGTAIDEMVRVLKPGGLLFADIVPKRFSSQSLGNVLNATSSIFFWSLKLKPNLGLTKAKRYFKPPYFENDLSIEEYQKLFKKAGLKNLQIRGNRPFPRLTLPKLLDRIYALVLKPLLPLWYLFDRIDNPISRFWGAGLWFWGLKQTKNS